jgi:hypothetical protein
MLSLSPVYTDKATAEIVCVQMEITLARETAHLKAQLFPLTTTTMMMMTSEMVFKFPSDFISTNM